MFRRIGIRKTRNTDDFLGSGTKLLFTLLSLRFSDMGRERETRFLTTLTVCPSSVLNSLTQRTRGHPVDPNWSGVAQIKNCLPSSSVESQLTAFFQIPKSSDHRFRAWSYPQSHFLSVFFLFRYLWLSHPHRTRVNTCTQCVHLTNPCTKPKGSQPN